MVWILTDNKLVECSAKIKMILCSNRIELSTTMKKMNSSASRYPEVLSSNFRFQLQNIYCIHLRKKTKHMRLNVHKKEQLC